MPRDFEPADAERLARLQAELDACQAAYAHICEAIVPGSGPGGAAAMATTVLLFKKQRDDARGMETILRGLLADAVNDLKAVADGLPLLQCPKCRHPQVDYDGFGLLACTRDPKCYCTHPGSTDGVCDICGEKDSEREG